MAILQPPVLPLRLYRYRNLTARPAALDEEMSAVRENFLYCAEFSRMNDPMEGFYRPSAGVEGRDNYRQALDKIYNRKENIGIACFSETNEDILMWTHYAGNHSGICLGYSTKILVDGLSHSVDLVRVAYVDTPPRITSVDLRNTEVAARKVLSQKRYSWTSEREWRVLGSVGRVDIEGVSAVRNIYLGSRVSDTSKKEILRRIKGTKIEAYAMKIDRYSHEWVPINAAAKAAQELAPEG